MAEAMAPFIGSPQVTAIREIAIDGACGPWSTAATKAASSNFACARLGTSPLSISHTICAKAKRANQFLNRITADNNFTGVYVDDGSRPPCRRLFEQLICRQAPIFAHTAPTLFRRSISLSANPSSRSTSVVC